MLFLPRIVPHVVTVKAEKRHGRRILRRHCVLCPEATATGGDLFDTGGIPLRGSFKAVRLRKYRQLESTHES